jgi:hypothetical protein
MEVKMSLQTGFSIFTGYFVFSFICSGVYLWLKPMWEKENA